MATEENVLIEDGEIYISLGKTRVVVHALCIEASVKWSKAAKLAWFQQARLNLDVAEKDDPNASTESRVNRFTAALANGAADDLLMVRGLVMAHSPEILTADVVNTATALQIVKAFEALFELENPMRRLRQAMQT